MLADIVTFNKTMVTEQDRIAQERRCMHYADALTTAGADGACS